MDPIMFGVGIFAFVLAVGLVAAVTRGPQRPGTVASLEPFFFSPSPRSASLVFWRPLSQRTSWSSVSSTA